MNNTMDKAVTNMKRQMIRDILDQCTKDQQEFFDRIWPNGVPDEDLEGAYSLCERTIKKNEQEKEKP